MEQYANDRSPGQGVSGTKSPEAVTLLAFGRLMEATVSHLETQKKSQTTWRR